EPQYIDGVLNSPEEAGDGAEGMLLDTEADPLYDQAVEIVVKNRRASISLVQRHLRIGYNRAARLVEQMEAAGIVSAMQSNGNREVLAPKST
ncbi:MAG TPA: DNA translocase FtsK, partial [Gallionella sp.]|nr:DNA translocase FtsK [Gallionella sp.]